MKVPSLKRLQEVLGLAGLALVAVAEDGVRVPPMRANAVRDLGRRRFPAHLDVLATEADVHAERRKVRDRRKAMAQQRRQASEDARHAGGIPPSLLRCLCASAEWALAGVLPTSRCYAAQQRPHSP